MEKLDYGTFKVRIAELPDVIYSISGGVPYKICSLQCDTLTIQRKSTESFVRLNIKELYEYFT